MARFSAPPTISVLICTCDRFDGLQRALASVRAQTHPVHQIIVVDDGSTDPRYTQPPPPDVTWHRAAPSSRAACGFPCLGYVKNLGLALATGEWVAFLDDDDVWLPTKLERQVAALADNTARLVGTEAWRGRGSYEPGRRYRRYFAEWARLPEPLPPRLTAAHFAARNPLLHSSVLVERALLRAVGGYDELPLGGVVREGRVVVEDWELWRRCLGATDALFVPEPLVYYDGARETAPRFWADYPALRARTQIGFVVTATGRYTTFLAPLFDSVRRFFLPDARVTLFVFTDCPAAVPAGAVALPVEHRPWPYATLCRFHHFRQHAERLAACDYLFQCDADMRFVAAVGPEVFPTTATGLVGVEHPGFCWEPSWWQRLLRRAGVPVRRGRGRRGSYEEDPRSLAYVAPQEGECYYAGGFNGGTAAAFLALAREIANRIDRDLAAGHIAVWHDESHLNRYFIDHPPHRLDPRYCYPEDGNLPFPRVLLALKKDHAAMRSAL